MVRSSMFAFAIVITVVGTSAQTPLTKIDETEKRFIDEYCHYSEDMTRGWNFSKGVLHNTTRLIKGGEYANLNQFAAAAAILRRNQRGEWEAYCSAIVLSNKHIMTAAHCVTDKHSGQRPVPITFPIKVMVGGVCWADSVECREHELFMYEVYIKLVAYSNNYVGKHSDKDEKYDVAIIEVHPLTGSALKRAKPACLPGQRMPDQRFVYIVGFGDTEDHKPEEPSERLKFGVNRWVVASDPHYRLPGCGRTDRDKTFCYVSERDPTTQLPATRGGDSGGPVMSMTYPRFAMGLHIGHAFGKKHTFYASYGLELRLYAPALCKYLGLCPPGVVEYDPFRLGFTEWFVPKHE